MMEESSREMVFEHNHDEVLKQRKCGCTHNIKTISNQIITKVKTLNADSIIRFLMMLFLFYTESC